MSKPELNIGIIGYNFMGKAHSNAWLQANRFFEAPYHAVLKAACGRNEAATQNGKVVAGTRTETFSKAANMPVHIPLSGKTMEFDGAGMCVAGC